MIYLLQTDDGIQYPYALGMLRASFPGTSFPEVITPETGAAFGCFPVLTTERPDHDPAVERIEEQDPIQLEDGTWQQVLTVRAATPEEQAAYLEENRPSPQWVPFSASLMASPGVNVMLSAVLQQAPGIYGGLVVGLNEASKGDARVFLSAWDGVEALGLIGSGLRDAIYMLAIDHHLPIAARFLPPAESVGQKHTTPDGRLWRVMQARDADGQFTCDDPATVTRESLEWA